MTKTLSKDYQAGFSDAKSLIDFAITLAVFQQTTAEGRKALGDLAEQIKKMEIPQYKR